MPIDNLSIFAQTIAETAAYSSSKEAVPQTWLDQIGDNLFDSVHFPYSRINEITTHSGSADAMSLAKDCWIAAREAKAVRYYEDKLIFPLAPTDDNPDQYLEVSLRESDPTRSCGKPFFACSTFAHPILQESTIAGIPRELEHFAWLGQWPALLENLAKIVLPGEKWDFALEEGETPRNEILRNYLKFTFWRLVEENKICISEDDSFCAFNTGLVDNRFDDIYMCFIPNNSGDLPWRFSGFASSHNRELKKRLNRTFNPLPEQAQYVENIEDLLFRLDRTYHIDYQHILVDNTSRLPLQFLEEELRDDQEAMEILADIRSAQDENERKECFDQLSTLIDTDTRLYRRLNSRLEDAVDLARRRIRWNFKTAIPSYYPRNNSMSLLLPLCLVNEQDADCALVMNLTPSGSYQGQTILTMDLAYKHARLICRPDSEWLRPA